MELTSLDVDVVEITSSNASFEKIFVSAIEHRFPRTENVFVHILSWISLVLIYLTNSVLINFILKKASKTALDWMMMLDCFLCVCNSIQIINGVFVDHLFAYHCYFFPFFAFSISICNRLLEMAIVVYRYVHVLQPSIIQGSVPRHTFETTIFFSIFSTTAVMTGYLVYFKDDYRLYYCEYFINKSYQNQTESLRGFRYAGD